MDNSHPGWVHTKDGPAGGRKFYVQRAPVYLRLVQSTNHTWDVLDLLEDEPVKEEEIFVYRQTEWVHVRGQNPRDSGMHYTYIHVPITIDQKAHLRYAHRWRAWASLQAEEAA